MSVTPGVAYNGVVGAGGAGVSYPGQASTAGSGAGGAVRIVWGTVGPTGYAEFFPSQAAYRRGCARSGYPRRLAAHPPPPQPAAALAVAAAPADAFPADALPADASAVAAASALAAPIPTVPSVRRIRRGV